MLFSDKICNHCTGFPSVKILKVILKCLDPGKNGENMLLSNSQLANEGETKGRKRALSPIISFILTLVQLRRNFNVKQLMYLFKTSEETVLNTILTWINYMYIKLGSLSIWPNASQVKRNMLSLIKDKFPNVKYVIDCIEFKLPIVKYIIDCIEFKLQYLYHWHYTNWFILTTKITLQQKHLLGLHQVEDFHSFLQFFQAVFQTKTLQLKVDLWIVKCRNQMKS